MNMVKFRDRTTPYSQLKIANGINFHRAESRSHVIGSEGFFFSAGFWEVKITTKMNKVSPDWRISSLWCWWDTTWSTHLFCGFDDVLITLKDHFSFLFPIKAFVNNVICLSTLVDEYSAGSYLMSIFHIHCCVRSSYNFNEQVFGVILIF